MRVDHGTAHPRAGYARALRWARVARIVPLALVASCTNPAMLTRPEGDGGWSAERRAREIEQIGHAAGVDVGQMDAMAASAGEADVASETPVEPLTLRDALARCARGNRRLAEARQQLAIARQQVWEARGRLFPATIGTGRYTWNSDAQTNSVTLATTPGGAAVTNTIEVRDQELGELRGLLTIPLDLSGEIRHVLLGAQAGYRGEAARLWATALEQEVIVISAYFTLLEAERLRDVTAQTIALHRQQLDFAQDRYENGRLTKNEVLVVQVGLRNAEQQALQRQLAIDEARWALNEALGLAIDAPTRVRDVRQRPTLPASADALAIAYRENPVLRALFEDQQRLEADATALARSRLPRFSGGGSVDKSTSDVLEPNLISAGFVAFDWDLGTDTRREARIAEARIAAGRNRTHIERELRQLEQAVRATYRATEERLAALSAAEVAVGQAEENLRIRQQQFDAGRATSEDVLDAEALLAQQRATLASALYQAHIRRAELQRLMGQPLEAATYEES